MTIRHIKTFCEVCRQGGITKAAQALCVAQPSVSQTISELEDYYGVKLFERVGRKLILTPEGQRLRIKAEEAAACFNAFEQAATDERAKPSVRIGASMTVGKMLVPRLICAVQSRIDGVDCRAMIASTSAIEREILSGGLDFAVVEGRISGDICAEEYAGDELVAVCAPGKGFPAEAEAKMLVKLPLLLRLKGSASRDLLDVRLSELGLSADPVVASSGNSALISAAKCGLGAAVLPHALVEEDISRGQLVRIDLPGLDLQRTWFIISRRGKKFTSAQKAALDICRSRSY